MTSLSDMLLARQGNLFHNLDNRDPARARAALYTRKKGLAELALLLSPGADPLLEEIALMAHRVKKARFGRTVQLYAPLYVSNYCSGTCPYCGFRRDRRVERRSIGLSEIRAEAALLKAAGIQHVLIVSGEDNKNITSEFLCTVVAELKKDLPSVTIEVPPLSTREYSDLVAAGVDGVTLYQETYDFELYRQLHNTGPKADYEYRLAGLHRAGEGGMRKLTLGALLGLAPWRSECLALAVHAAHLQKKHWRSDISFGFPRLHSVPRDFKIPYPVDDRSFVHLIMALRVCFEDAGLVLSTRESPRLRDRLVDLGITQMSAGSSTSPGGYGKPDGAEKQFAVSDERTPGEVAEALRGLGYDPVAKDWDRVFGGSHD